MIGISASASCLLMYRLPKRTALTAAKSSFAASRLTTYPRAPVSKASRAISESSFAVRNRILESGETERIRRAASIPFSFGRPMSSTTKSGFSSCAF